MSYTTFKQKDLKPLGNVCLAVLKLFRVVDVQEKKKQDGVYMECNNLTFINLLLKFLGPMHERKLVTLLLVIQVSNNRNN